MDAKTLIMLFLFFGAVALLKWLVIDAIWNAAAPEEKSWTEQLPAGHPDQQPIFSQHTRLLFGWAGRIFAAGTLIYSLRGLWHLIREISG